MPGNRHPSVSLYDYRKQSLFLLCSLQTVIFLENPPYCDDWPVIRRRCVLDASGFCAGMYNRIAANINPNMAAVTYDVPRLHGICAYAVANALECAGRMRKPNAERCVYAHDKPGTVSAVCKACTAPYIGVAYELACIIGNCLPISAAWRVISLAGGCRCGRP